MESHLERHCPNKKEHNANAESKLFTSTLQCAPAMGVHYGLPQDTAQKLNMEATCVFPEHRETLLKCLLNGSVKFKGSSSVFDDKDLQSLYGCNVRNEDNYLNNFVIEAYLHLIASTSISKGVKVEILEWEVFEKGFSKGAIKGNY